MMRVPFSKYGFEKLWFIVILLAVGMASVLGHQRLRANGSVTTEIRVQDHYTVSVPGNFPPRYQVDKRGQMKGYAYDVGRWIAGNMGAHFAFKNMGSWKNSFDALRTGQSDIIVNVGITAKRQLMFDFTSPYDTFHLSFFKRASDLRYRSRKDLGGVRVGVVRLNAAAQLLHDDVTIQRVEYNHQVRLLFALLSGTIDVIAYPEAILLNVAHQAGVRAQIERFGNPIAEVKRAMAVRKGNADLLARLEKQVQAFVGSPAHQELYRKWITPTATPVASSQALAFGLGGAILLFLLIVAVRYTTMVRVNKRLEKTVATLEETQLALELSEGTLATAQRSAHLGSWEYNLKTSEMSGSDEIYHLLGCVPNPGESLSIGGFVHGDDRRRYDDVMARSLASGNRIDSHYRMVRKDGIVRSFHMQGNADRDADNQVVRLTGTLQDVSRQKWIENKIRNANARLKMIINVNPTVIYGLRRQKECRDGIEFSFMSDAVKDITGHPSNVWLRDNQFWRTRLHEDDRHEMAVLEMKAFSREYRLLKPDGSYCWIQDKRVVVRDRHGEIMGAYGSWMDLSQRKQIESELEKAKNKAESANLAKSKFLAHISHELRTPLNAILGFGHIVETDQHLPVHLQEHVRTIRESADYLLTLINDILDLSKIEADCLEIEIHPFGLSGFIESVSKLFHLRAQESGNVFTCKRKSVIDINVLGDEKRLRQVLINLLSNAMKFTENGHVTLTIDYKNGQGHFCVRDTGCGISKQNLNQIFEPFEKGTNENFIVEGSGLGLTITKNLIERMGAQISVTSEVGEGSCFEVIVSLEQTSLQVYDSMPQFGVHYEPLFVDCSVLVVDDNHDNAAMLKQLLQRHGFDVRVAIGGQACLDTVVDFEFDIILLDLVMPRPDGFEVAEILRRQKSTRCIIAVSANAFIKDRGKCHAAGFDDFIAKPVQASKLLACLKKNLEAMQPAKPGMVLIADDSSANRQIFRIQTHDCALTVVEATDGRQALEAIKKTAFDLIFLDIEMPYCSGIEVVKTLRQSSTLNGKTTVIAMTGHIDRDQSLRDAGFDRVLHKPLEGREWITLLHAYHDKKKERQRISPPPLPVVDPRGAPFCSLKKNCLGNEKLCRKIVEEFYSSLEQHLRECRQARANSDWKLLLELTHAVNSNAKTVSYGDLTAVASVLEKDLSQGGKDDHKFAALIRLMRKILADREQTVTAFEETLVIPRPHLNVVGNPV